MSQQSVLEAMRQQIQTDFPITKPAGIPTPPQPTEIFCERYTEYQGEPREWLLTMPTPVDDMKAVSFSRVSQTLTYTGTRLYRTPPKPISDGVDTDAYIQSFIDQCGLSAEAYNAAGEVVKKYITHSETLNLL